MITDTVSTFESSLARLDVGCTRTDRDGFVEALDAVVEAPAVGVPLYGFEGISLDDTVVTVPPTPRLLTEAKTGVAPVGKAIAEYGTLVVESDAAGTEPVSLYPPTHVAVVRLSDVLPNVESAMGYLRDRYEAGESAIFATGVSSTGDMGALVEGVHGPKTVHVILLTDQ